MLVLFRSFILSSGYVNATTGAINVKNAMYINLFIYLIVNTAVNVINAMYIIKYAVDIGKNLSSFLTFKYNLA